MISDLLYSGGIDRDADLINMLFRDEYYSKKPSSEEDDLTAMMTTLGKGEFITRKNRHGPLGTIELDFKKGSWQSDYLHELFNAQDIINEAKRRMGLPTENNVKVENDDLPF